MNVADALHSKTFENGSLIIKQVGVQIIELATDNGVQPGAVRMYWYHDWIYHYSLLDMILFSQSA